MKESAVLCHSRRAFALALVSLAIAGCGGSKADLPPVVPVSGTVTLDGKPLANAGIVFIPVGQTRGGTCSGATDDNGRYELTDRDGRKGTTVGEFKVTCNKWVMPDGKDFPRDSKVSPLESNARELLPPRYSNEAQTQLKATIPEGGKTVDFELKTRR
jgi:hypothetical protein